MCFEVVAMVAQIAGTVAGVQSANAAATAQQQMYDYQAQVEENNAKIAGKQAEQSAEQGALEEKQLRQRTSAFLGQQKAGFSANGLDISGGSPLDVLADTNYLGTLDAETSRLNKDQRVWALKNQQNDYLAQGQLYRTAGQNVIIAGKNNATAALLNGVGSLANQYSVFAGGQKKTKVPTSGGGMGDFKRFEYGG